MSFEVIVVGSCNVDLTSYVDRTPMPGETISGNSFQMSFGGKGANQAVMATLMGCKVAMVGKVGDDFFGKSYHENFKSLHMTTDYVEKGQTGTSSGTAAIIVNKDGQNCIIIHGGANQEVDEPYVKRVLTPLLKGAKVLMTQNEIVPQATLEALKLAKEAKVITVFNPAPATAAISSEFYKYTDILCCNEIEIFQLSGIELSEDESYYSKAAKILLLAGCRYVLLTLGEKGAMLYSMNCLKGDEVPLKHKVDKVVDTTGSGDALLGSLAYFIVDNLKVNERADYITPGVVEKAVTAASFTVTSKGAQSSYAETAKDIKRTLSIPF